ncbi:hypothetical protein BGZ91_010775 [Linnemannia elongata]|nr:hypothetical protein BGZ91_010775 [Linnemannia elongata]
MRGQTGPRFHRCTTTFSNTVLAFLLVLLCWTPYPIVVEAWPYVDCSATNSIFALQRVTAHYDHGNNSIGLSLQGNFTDTYWAQGYSELATSKWRTSIQTTIMGTQLYRSEGPACANDGSGMIIGGCPTTPGLGTIQTSFNISQAAPFAELMVTMQIVGSNNQSIVCVAVLLEQTMETANNAVSFLPLALACLSGTISPANATDVLTFGGAGSVNQVQDSRAGSSRGGGSSIIAPTTTTTAATVVTTTTEGPRSRRKRDLSHEQQLGFTIGQDLLPLAWTTQAASALRVTIIDPRATPRVYIHPTLPAKRQIQIDVGPDGTTSVSQATPTVTDATSVSTSTPDTSTSTTTTTTSDSKSSSSSSSSSSSTTTTSKSPVRPNPPVTRTSPSRPPASSTSPTLIIPTIRDAFTNTSESNIQHNVSRFGIEAYAAAIGAFPSSLFLGTLVNAALAMVATLLLSGGFLGIAWMMAKEKHQRGKTLQHALNFVAGNMLRVWSLLYTPLALTAMYQLTISGGVALTVGSAASLLVISVGATIFFTWRILRGSSEHLLFDDLGTLLKYGPLYNTLAQEGTLFFLVTLLVRFLWGLAVAMLPTYGVAQVAVLLVIELGYTLVIGVKWPFSESTDNKFHLFLGIIRIVITGLSIGYIHDIEASPELRELLAYIQMALHLAVFIVMFALTLWNLIQACMFWHSRHSDTWKGPTKTYNFEDPSREVEQGWGLNGRPFLHSGATHSRGVAVSNNNDRGSGEGDDDDDFGAGKNRRFTVMSYSSLGSSQGAGAGGSGARRESMQHALHAQQMRQQHHESSDDETLRYGSPAERYRQSRLGDHGRSAFSQTAPSETGSGPPDSGYMGPILLSSTAAGSGLKGGATSPPSDTSTIDGRQSQLAMKRGGLPQRDSYASLQRMSHQQPSTDPRTRRMSDITRDGPYLYNAHKEERDGSREAAAAAAAVVRESASKSGSGLGLWAGVKASLAGVFRFGRRSNHSSPSSDGSKPKAFEVMRPPRRNFAAEPESPTLGDHADETGSQVGGDTRQLNSIGLSKFFQESDRGYEKNSNLVVANPSAMISRTGSLVSTVSGAVGPHASIRLQRDGSGTAESIKTLRNARSRGAGVGSGLGPSAAVAAATVAAAAAASGAGSTKESGLGIDTSGSEHGGASVSISDRESRRASSALMSGAGSITGSQLYPPRHSVESSNNLAEAMTIEEPLQLDGGGTLKVSKGPEKAVQYFHKGSGPYSRSIAESLKDQKRLSKPEGLSATTISSSSVSTPSLLLPPIQTRQLGSGSGSVPAAGQKVITSSPSASSSPTTKSPTSAGGPNGLGDISASSHDSNSVSLSGGVGSDGSSPTESQPSPNANVAVSAGRMHEILGRMFSDRSIRLHSGAGGAGSDHDSDSVLSEDAPSSPSGGPVSTAIGRRSLLGQTETTTHHCRDDSKSIDQYDLLQPVMEGSDLEGEDDDSYGVGEIDQDRTPRQSNFALVTPSTASLVVPGGSSSGSGSDSGSRTELLKRATSLSAEKPPHLITTASGSSPLVRSQSGGPTSPTSPTGSSASKQHQQGKLRPQQRSIGGRPLAHSPLHEPSVLLRTATAGAAAANAAAGIASTGSGNSSPHLTSAPLSLGGSDLSRQSSLQSGAGSPRLDYLDANWMHSEPNTGPVDQSSLNRNASSATARSEASYVTAYSQYPSDED